jgi:hypothetical protein
LNEWQVARRRLIYLFKNPCKLLLVFDLAVLLELLVLFLAT